MTTKSIHSLNPTTPLTQEQLDILSALFKQSHVLEEDKIYDVNNKSVQLTHTIKVIKSRDGSPRIEISRIKKEPPATIYNVIGLLNSREKPPVFEKVKPYYRIETSVINPLEMSPSESQFLHAVFIGGKVKYLDKNSQIKLKNAEGDACYIYPNLNSKLIRRESTRERKRQEKNPLGRIQTLDRVIGEGSNDTKVFVSHTLVPRGDELTLKTHYQAEQDQVVPMMRAVKVQTESTPSVKEKKEFIHQVQVEAMLSQRKKTLGMKRPSFLVGASEVTSYLTLNLFPGKEFFETYDRNSHLHNIEIMIGAFLEIADLHASGVISRDIKPENLMVHSPNGKKSTVNLIDLGLGKLAEADDTKEGLVGSHVYISPEKWRHTQKTTAEADLYAAYRVLGESLGAEIANTLNEDGSYKPKETEQAIFNFNLNGMETRAQLAPHHVKRLKALVQNGTDVDPHKRPNALTALEELTAVFIEATLVNHANKDSLIQAAKCAMQFRFLLDQSLRNTGDLPLEKLRALLKFEDHPHVCAAFSESTYIQTLASAKSHDAIIKKVESIALTCSARRKRLENIDHRLLSYTENKLSAALLNQLRDIKRDVEASFARQAEFNPMTLDRMETLSQKYEKDWVAIDKKMKVFEIQMKREFSVTVANHAATMFAMKRKAAPQATPLEALSVSRSMKIIRRS